MSNADEVGGTKLHILFLLRHGDGLNPISLFGLHVFERFSNEVYIRLSTLDDKRHFPKIVFPAECAHSDCGCEGTDGIAISQTTLEVCCCVSVIILWLIQATKDSS